MLAFKVVLFILLVPGTVTVLVPYLIVTARGEVPAFDLLGLVGLFAIALGWGTLLQCAWDFARSGRGTPAPIDPPRRLVVQGLYRFVRNPMYLGAVTILLGEAALFRSPSLLLYGAACWLGSHLFVLLYEEPTLRRMFGAEYDAYCQTVPRWLPRWRRSRAKGPGTCSSD
ncbi:MAG: isoprenylcysteine carboxylmethyltransferase family protein [Nitrospirae bacterium]|nr:isoprenylcysteine carboxylmethyltransferase family protein [Nitrospirota bacterium]